MMLLLVNEFPDKILYRLSAPSALTRIKKKNPCAFAQEKQ
jgi:hypothetical protein